MKRNLFAIGAAVAVLMFVACNQPIEIDGDVSVAANRPGAPSEVTITPNNVATDARTMISWTVGENSGDYWELFLRKDANSPVISGDDFDFSIGNVAPGTATWKTVGTGTTAYQTWVKDALTATNMNKRYFTFQNSPDLIVYEAWQVGPYQVGIRDAYTFDSANNAESDIAWSTGVITFTLYAPPAL